MSVKLDKSSKKSLCRRLSSLADCDIVKKGALHMKRPPKNMKIRLKTWQTRYFVLRDDSYDRGCRLEIYPNENNWNECRHSDRIIIDLRQVTHIEEYRQSRSFPFSFVITRRGQTPLVLGTSGEAELREWIVAVQLLACKTMSITGQDYYHDSALTNGLSLSLSTSDPFTMMAMRNNALNTSIESALYKSPITTFKRPYSVDVMSTCLNTSGKESRKWGYLADVLPTAAAKRNRLSGEYSIQVVDDCIVLRKNDVNAESIRWDLVHVRKLKSEEISGDSLNEMLTLEASVHCGHREGMYQFKTPYGRNIIAKVRETVRIMSLRSPRGTPPNATLPRTGLCHKSESDPCLERRRYQSSSSCSSSSRQLSCDWVEDDCPPRQMAPVPKVSGSPTGWSQGSRDSSSSGSRASSDREQDDELPPPYLVVLAAEDDYIIGDSGSDGSDHQDSCGSVFEPAPRRHNVTRGDSGFSEMPDDIRSLPPTGRSSIFRAPIDSCPDEPPPPPPRPRHTMSSHINYKNTRDFHPVQSEEKPSASTPLCPPPLPPRDF